jgi:sugar/nucleoside kinase (ribokinase family)
MKAAILCIGAAHWDLIARAAAPLPAGADVPGHIEQRLGGVALNVALALAAIGRPVSLLAAVGRDAEGDRLIAELRARGVDWTRLWRHDGPTDRYVAIEGPDGELHAAVADCTGLETAWKRLLALPPWRGPVVFDGNLPPAAIDTLRDWSGGPLTAVPASPEKAGRLAPLLETGRTRFYVNRREAEALCGATFDDTRAAARALRARGAVEALVTDGPAPVTVASATGTLSLAPLQVATRSLTGAGDALVAAHIAARADGLDAEAALRAALAASARHIAQEAS